MVLMTFSELSLSQWGWLIAGLRSFGSTKTTGPCKLHGHRFDWRRKGTQVGDRRIPLELFGFSSRWRLGGSTHKLEPAQLANFFQCGLVPIGKPKKSSLVADEQCYGYGPGRHVYMCLFWTGHSARHSVPQVAAAIGCPKRNRNFLGCWSIGSWLCSFSNRCGGLPERAIQPS